MSECLGLGGGEEEGYDDGDDERSEFHGERRVETCSRPDKPYRSITSRARGSHDRVMSRCFVPALLCQRRRRN